MLDGLIEEYDLDKFRLNLQGNDMFTAQTSLHGRSMTGVVAHRVPSS